MQLKLSDVYPYSRTFVGQFLEAEGKVVAVMLPYVYRVNYIPSHT